MLLHDKVLKHHPFATSLPVKQVPSKIGQKSNSCYIALKGILSCKSSLVLQKAFSCLLSLLHLSIIGELKSQIVNQRLQFLPPSIIIATYHNLQTSLFEPAEGNFPEGSFRVIDASQKHKRWLHLFTSKFTCH